MLIQGGPASAIVAATSSGPMARIAGRAKVFSALHIVVVLLSGGSASGPFGDTRRLHSRRLGASEL
jgi:hypothetical protein